jgi:hypothetical protein
MKDAMPKDTDIIDATQQLAEARDLARQNALIAIGAMLGRVAGLISTIARLRGAPNLASSTNPYRGYLVRAKKSDKGLPFPRRGSDGFGREQLVLTEEGQVVMARRNEDGDVNARFPDPSEFTADDAEHLAETIEYACENHMRACESSTEQYKATRDLAVRLRTALEAS